MPNPTLTTSSVLAGLTLVLSLAPFVAGCAAPEMEPSEGTESHQPGTRNTEERFRIGLFNIKELRLENIESDISTDGYKQLVAAAEIIQQHRPDILVVNEVDALPGRLEEAARKLESRFLNAGDNAISYPYVFVAPTNTGELADQDFDNDGKIATEKDLGTRQHGGDAFGYGTYPGEYGMALLSRFPIDTSQSRTFQKFLWRDLPESLLPEDWYTDAEAEVFRLSSKSHWDVVVELGKTKQPLHLLMSHPTPQGFDGDDDRNGKRNFDEIRFWRLYLDGNDSLYDDTGSKEPLAKDATFILAGDLNAAPTDAVTYSGITNIAQLLEHPRIQDTGPTLTSVGGLAGRVAGPPDYFEQATTGFGEGRRIDYLLPSLDLEVEAGGVYWPAPGDGETRALVASDHRFVWLDLRFAR